MFSTELSLNLLPNYCPLGSRVCGKGGLYSPNPVRAIEKRATEIDLEAFHKDLHPELRKTAQVIKNNKPAATHVVSKVSSKPQWFERMNRCCMDHEGCDKSIPAKTERYNYKNDREYTIYDCRCDDSFAQCLKYADSYTADAVGDLYFNVLKMPCINFNGESGNATIDSQTIIDKVAAALEKRPAGNRPEINPLEEANAKPNTEGSPETKLVGEQRSIALATDKELSDAVEREAKHFNRNGHPFV